MAGGHVFMCGGVCMVGVSMAGGCVGRGRRRVRGRGGRWVMYGEGGGRHAWQERQSLQRTLRILLNGILVLNRFTNLTLFTLFRDNG